MKWDYGDTLKDDPAGLAVEHDQTEGGHYGYDNANCPKCHKAETND